MTSPRSNPLQVAARVAAALDELGVKYSIGGSLASSFSGEPRSTLDVDMVVALDKASGRALVKVLEREFYVDQTAIDRAVRSRGTANLIHTATSIKVDLFVAGGSALDEATLDRRVAVIVEGPPTIQVFVHSPEDILLQKLRWYRLGGEVSDRQWRDALGIVRVQGERLDRSYLAAGGGRLGVADLVTRLLTEGLA